MEIIGLTKNKHYRIIRKKNNYKKYIKIKLLFLLSTIISFSFGVIIGTKFQNKKIKNKPPIFNLTNLNNFTTYAQCLEDLILYCIFYDTENGFYIDAGGYDPHTMSVTNAFYLNEWRGINIEPIPEYYAKFVQFRERDINLNIGVGEKSDKATLCLRGGLSSINKKYSQNCKNAINIEVQPLSKICKKYIPKNVEILICKIDVEGNERNVLLGYDFVNYRPKVFCIEAAVPGTTIPSHSEWEDILIKNDYSFGIHYDVNRFYYDKRVKYLSERFLNLESYIQYYKAIHPNKK